MVRAYFSTTETDLLPALRIIDLTETEADLIAAFVPVVVDEADGLSQYRETKERADELDEKIKRTDDLIDEIVYELYGLTEEEIEIVEENVA
nr:hypothetical protein [Halolamina sp. CBA1230]